MEIYFITKATVPALQNLEQSGPYHPEEQCQFRFGHKIGTYWCRSANVGACSCVPALGGKGRVCEAKTRVRGHPARSKWPTQYRLTKCWRSTGHRDCRVESWLRRDVPRRIKQLESWNLPVRHVPLHRGDSTGYPWGGDCHCLVRTVLVLVTTRPRTVAAALDTWDCSPWLGSKRQRKKKLAKLVLNHEAIVCCVEAQTKRFLVIDP